MEESKATNLSQIKRRKMLETLKKIKQNISDEETLNNLSLIENELNEKKYGLIWEEHEERVDKELKTQIPVFENVADKEIVSDEKLKYNFLLEGDNLHSLYLLEKTHGNSVDVIYIDPPYNRGKDDFVYNDDYVDAEDDFMHSKWLSFMNRRLRIAKNILKESGTIFISIDDNELSGIKLLCDEIFGASNFLGIIHWRRRSNQPNDKTKMIGLVAEYIVVYAKNRQELEKLGIGKIGITGSFSNPDNDPRGPWASKPWKTGGSQSGTRYKIVSPTGKEFNEEWMGSEETFQELLKDGRIFFTNNGKGLPRKKYYQSEREEEGQCATNWWSWEEFGSNQNATDELKQIFGGTCPFDNPKPTKLVKAIIGLGCVKKDALVLDFFAGSGTTAQATIDLNQEDGGERHFILCTNNEIDGKSFLDFMHDNRYLLDYQPGTKTKSSTIKAKIEKYICDNNLTSVIEEKSAELQSYGICQRITYPRILSVINNKANLKYYKTSYVPRIDTEEENLHNNLLTNIKNLIQLENGINIDDKSIKVFLDEEEFDKMTADKDALDECDKVYISSDILMTSEQEKILENNNIDVFAIPEYYFKDEIVEVTE